MLSEIYCNKFIDEGKERGPIRLKPGLNAVIGAERANNSIGKSTFLMVIDFCFGGDDYADPTGDVFLNVGEHVICFTHEFDGVEYRFSRSMTDPTLVWRCDEEYRATEKLTTRDFRGFLAEKYGMAGLGGSFRDLIGCFMRVYGRGCRDVNHPMRSFDQEAMSAQLDRLTKWFGQYASIEEMKRLAKEAAAEKDYYNKALSHNFVAAASSKRDVAENEKRISELEANKDELVAQSRDNLADIDPLVAARIAELKRELSALRRQRMRLISQVAEMDDDLASSKFKASKDIAKLAEFFPGADIKRIEEIEAFHRQLASVLKKEHTEVKSDLKGRITLLSERIANVEWKIREIAPETNVTIAVLESYSDISAEIRKLRDANDAFEKKARLAERAKALNERSKTYAEEALRTIQQKVNIRLSELNAEICGGERTAPFLNIKSPSNYELTVENDSGTGAETRGLFLFDIVMAEQTPLPAIVHDSCDVKDIEDETMVGLMELYDKSRAQVFMATDKAEAYTSSGIPEVLERCAVLRLDVGHELYGRSWNRRNDEEGAARRHEDSPSKPQ